MGRGDQNVRFEARNISKSLFSLLTLYVPPVVGLVTRLHLITINPRPRKLVTVFEVKPRVAVSITLDNNRASSSCAQE